MNPAYRFARVRTLAAALIGIVTAITAVIAPAVTAAPTAARQLPEFPHPQAADWLNSPPLTVAALRGHPVLVEFWTFECSNCLATLPWIRTIADRYRDQGLVVVGVHTPELPGERDPAAVRRAVARLGISYPVMIDADYRYWNALDNHYWPAFYLYDADGSLIASRFGEQHLGEAGSVAFEQRIHASIDAARRAR